MKETVQPFEDLVARALAEDCFNDDVTARLIRNGQRPAEARISTREKGVFCGEKIIAAFQRLLGGDVRFIAPQQDGSKIEEGDILVRLEGPTALCLSVERTLLNLLSHACGISSLTRSFVDAVSQYPTKILATRKTLPGLRELQLYAVAAGGGYVHRRSLSDGVLIKENHQIFEAGTSLLETARSRRSPLHRVEIEVQTLAELDAVLKCPVDVIMLDNLGIEDLKEAIGKIGKKAEIEVSGGITLERAKTIAALGVSFISVGRLTHSVQALDLTLDIAPLQT